MTDLIWLPIIQPISEAGKQAFVKVVTLQYYPLRHVLFKPEQITPDAFFALKGAIRQYYLAESLRLI